MKHKKLIDTFLELIQIDSESRNERNVRDYVLKRLEGVALNITEDDTGDKIGGNCGNLVINIKGNTPGAPTILLNAHMDTVKPGNGIRPVIEGDTIRSGGNTILGADDKAGLSVILEAVRIIKEENLPHGNLQLVITVSEETGLLGARHLDPKLLNADFGLSLDCTGAAGTIFNSSPSHDTLKATIFGRAAHAGIEPEKGISAIRVASLAISKMTLGRVDEETTSNVGVIHGGLAVNIIPDTVILEGEARSHDPEKLKKQLKSMRDALETAAKECDAMVDVEIKHEYKSYKISEDAGVIALMKKAAAAIGVEPKVVPSGGGSDANMLNEYGVLTIPIGTAMRKCHSKEETILITELEGVLDWVIEALSLAAREGTSGKAET